MGIDMGEYTNEYEITDIWTCTRCTYQNEDTSHCSICDLSFNTSQIQMQDQNNTVLGDYLDPILDQMTDDNDEQLQFAIASSLDLTDSDDTDDTLSITTNKSTTKRTQKRKKKYSKSISFAQ